MRGRTTPLLEPQAQRWRALIVFHSGDEALLFVGRSYAHVSKEYVIPWSELFTAEERVDTKRILLQRWTGAPDRGHWQTQADLPIVKASEVAEAKSA